MAARKDRDGFDLISDGPPFGPAVGMSARSFSALPRAGNRALPLPADVLD